MDIRDNLNCSKKCRETTYKLLEELEENEKLRKENELLKEELQNLRNDITSVYNTMISLEQINKHELLSQEEIEEI